MRSMTGFGNASSKSKDLEVDVSLKSYNGRFLDVRIHLPREYEALEGEIKKKVSRKFQRGTVSVYVNRKINPGSNLVQVKSDIQLAKKVKSAYQKLNKELKLGDDLSLDHFLMWSEIIQVSQENKLTPDEKRQVMSAVDGAITKLDTERSREGKVLVRDLKKHSQKLKSIVNQIDRLSKDAKKGVKEKLKKRVSAINAAVPVDSQRLAQEAALQADKMDISEEVVRLKAHIAAYSAELNKGGAKGKKLDFFTQELLREVNTIASKSSFAKINHLSVEAKSVIEKIKEQVQNLE